MTGEWRVVRPEWRGALRRGFAIFLGAFCLLNLGLGLLLRGLDLNVWWIDLRFLPPDLERILLLASGLLLLAFGIRPAVRGWRKTLATVTTTLLLIAVLANAAVFYLLLLRGQIHAGFPIPLSLFVAAGLAAILWPDLRTMEGRGTDPGWIRLAAVVLVLAVVFPLLQMLCFGKTDYRRPAEVAVVPGARVYADGRPSDAVADRVRTACQLYRSGLAKKLLFSGGPGDGAVHETEGMKRMAMKLGVKPEDILVDEEGLNTRATVKNTRPLLGPSETARVLVVSHFYHLPRLKIAYQQDGMEVFTVPAKESYLLRQLPFNMAREVAAFWKYYLEALRRH